MDISELEQPPTLRLLPLTSPHAGPCVRDKVGMHQATIYGLIKTAGFPAPIKVGRRSLWIEREVDAWILNRVKDYRESA